MTLVSLFCLHFRNVGVKKKKHFRTRYYMFDGRHMVQHVSDITLCEKWHNIGAIQVLHNPFS